MNAKYHQHPSKDDDEKTRTNTATSSLSKNATAEEYDSRSDEFLINIVQFSK
jgi:hypothetical protein